MDRQKDEKTYEELLSEVRTEHTRRDAIRKITLSVAQSMASDSESRTDWPIEALVYHLLHNRKEMSSCEATFRYLRFLNDIACADRDVSADEFKKWIADTPDFAAYLAKLRESC